MTEEFTPGIVDPGASDDWAELGGLPDPTVGADAVYSDHNVWVVKFDLNAKDGSGTTTYYLGYEYWDAGELYSGSPIIYPLLAGRPENLVTDRRVGTEIQEIGQPAIAVYGKSHFEDYNKGFFDLSEQYEFYGSQAEIRCYFKARSALTTHADATNIFMSKLEIRNHSWNGDVLQLQCRDGLFKDKEISKKLDPDFFTDLQDDFEYEYGAIVFGQGVVVDTPFIKDDTFSEFTGNESEIFLGFTATGHPMNAFTTLYARNREGPADADWVPITLPAASSSVIHGQIYEVGSGDNESSLSDAYSVVFSPGPGTAYIIRGITVGIVRTPTAPTSDDGEIRLWIARAPQFTTAGTWIEENILREIRLDISISTTLAKALALAYPVVVATENENYLVGFEWTGLDASIADNSQDTGTDYTVDNATITGQGQEFQSRRQTEKIIQARFRLKIGGGTPTGSITSELYASDGASPAAPTGSALATSGDIPAEDLTASYREFAFHFDGTYTLTPQTDYFIVIRHANGDASNYVSVDGASSGNHAGNRAADNSGWSGDGTSDLWFQVKSAPRAVGYKLRYKTAGTNSNDNAQVRDNSVPGGSWAASNTDPYIAIHVLTRGSGFNDETGTAPNRYACFELEQSEWGTLVPSLVSDNTDGRLQYDLELKAKVSGLEDDGSGTYTGSGSAVIENPADIIRFILLDDEIGINYGSGNVDSSSFNTARTKTADDGLDMAFAIQEQTFAASLILRILRQSRLVMYKTRQGTLALHYPTNIEPPWDFTFAEGYLRDEIALATIVDTASDTVINDLEIAYGPDPLNTPKDSAIVKRLGDSVSYKSVTYLNSDESDDSDAWREGLAAESDTLYGRQTLRETFDLYGSDSTGPQTMRDYLFDAHRTKQTEVTVRVPFNLWYSADLFDKIYISHTELPAEQGTADLLRWHSSGAGITWYDEGIPIAWSAEGIIKGKVIGVRTEGDDYLITVITQNSIAASAA